MTYNPPTDKHDGIAYDIGYTSLALSADENPYEKRKLHYWWNKGFEDYQADTITLKDFMVLNNTPLFPNEIAEKASHIKDHNHLRDAAIQYLAAEDRFLAELNNIGFEIG